MKKEIVVLFNFTFAMLKQLCDSMLLLLDRDIAEHTDRGFTPAKREAFVNQLNAFIAIPTDNMLDGMKQTATQNKDKARAALEIAMRSIINMVEIVFKEFPGKQVEFGNFDLTRQTDEQLVRNGKDMTDAAKKYLTDLAAEGLTIAKITALETLRTAFDASIDLQRKSITDRNSVTESRRIEANKLYLILMDHSKRGKAIFADVSQAKYNDYIIYNTASGTDETPQEPPVNP